MTLIELLSQSKKPYLLKCKKCGVKVKWKMGAIAHGRKHDFQITQETIPRYYDVAGELKPLKKTKRKYVKRKPLPDISLEIPPETLPQIPPMQKPVIIKAEAVDGGMNITFEAFVPHKLVADMLLPTLF